MHDAVYLNPTAPPPPSDPPPLHPPDTTQGKRGGAMNMQPGRGATFEESLGNVVKVSLAR